MKLNINMKFPYKIMFATKINNIMIFYCKN